MTQRSHMLRNEWPELLLAKLGLAFGDHGLARGAPSALWSLDLMNNYLVIDRMSNVFLRIFPLDKRPCFDMKMKIDAAYPGRRQPRDVGRDVAPLGR